MTAAKKGKRQDKWIKELADQFVANSPKPKPWSRSASLGGYKVATANDNHTKRIRND